MHQPASVGGISPPADPLQALQFYSSLGLHCFPAAYADKMPHPRVGEGWNRLIQFPPPPPERWPDLVADWGRFNVALLCSDHLVVIDLDNLDFVAWFDAQGPERLGTWIVRSPRGGLHVYVRSDDAQRTTVIKSASGVKIGDVKARGGYVVAPPSVGSNGDYQTEYGSPDAITRQANAITWFSGFVQAWERTQPVRLQPLVNDGQPEYANTDVHSEPPSGRQEEILQRLRAAWLGNQLNRKIYDTLKDGADAADNYWKDLSDRSVIDFGCIKELIGLGWTFQEIEELWTFSPVGERYRSDERSHGHGYLLRTYDAAKRKWDAEQIDLQFAVGPDWILTGSVETWEEGRLRHFAFSLANRTTGEVHDLEVDGRAFTSPREFTRAMYGRAAFFDLGNFDSAKTLRTLAQAVKRLAVERPKPEMGTREGRLTAQLRALVSRLILPRVVSAQDDVRDLSGWCDGPHVYVLPEQLHRRSRLLLQPSPSEAEVWRQWRALGGEDATWQGMACWRAPRQSFPDLQLS